MGATSAVAYAVYGVVVPAVRRPAVKTATRSREKAGSPKEAKAEEAAFVLGGRPLSEAEYEELAQPWADEDQRLFHTGDAKRDVFGVLVARAADNGYGSGKGATPIPTDVGDARDLFHRLVVELGVGSVGDPQLFLVANA